MGTKRTKVPVGERALLQRLNRALAKDGQKICKSRGSELGPYYTVDLARGAVVTKELDIIRFAREVGILREWEAVADAR
jgi:hypothetical protein